MIESKKRRPVVDVEKVLQTRAEVEKRMEGHGELTFWKPDWGESCIRILPPYSELGIFWYDVAYHYGIASDSQGQSRQVVCPAYGTDNPCPICEKIAELKATGDEEDAAKADSMKLKPRYYLQIIDRADEAAGVQIYMASPTVANKILGFYSSKGWGDITDPENGYDLVLTKRRRAGAAPNSQRWQDTEYEVMGTPEKCPTMADKDGNPVYDWEDHMVELDKLPRKYAYDDLATMLETGEFIEWDDRTAKEEKPKTKAVKAAEEEPEDDGSLTPTKLLQMDLDTMLVLLTEYETGITEYEDEENLRDQIALAFSFSDKAMEEAQAELNTAEEAPAEEAPAEEPTPEIVFAMSEDELKTLLGKFETGLDPEGYGDTEELREAILTTFFDEADIEAARPVPPPKPELKRPIPKKTLPVKIAPKEAPKGKVVPKKSTDMDDKTSSGAAEATKDLKRRATKFQKTKEAATPAQPVGATKKRVPVKKV